MRKALKQLISEKEKELQNLEDSLGLGFPIIEQAKTTRICHLEAELEDLRGLEGQIKLNDNQKIVLEWLKEKTCKCNKPVYPMNLVRKAVEKMPVEIVNYYDHLSDREEFQVLAAFAQWGLEQEEAK